MIHSKNKGKRFEREVAEILRQHGFEARRGVQFRGGQDSPDVISNFPFHIEAKHVEKLNLQQAIEQAKKDAEGLPFCVIHKKNRTEPLITVTFKSFLELFFGDQKPPEA
jgi:Holliday junction resolvase